MNENVAWLIRPATKPLYSWLDTLGVWKPVLPKNKNKNSGPASSAWLSTGLEPKKQVCGKWKTKEVLNQTLAPNQIWT